MAKTQRVLTGITTTGTPHLGNYVGAIRPAIAASRQAGVESFFFLADYHALIKCADPERIERSRLEIAATWLAAGLDPARVTFYRQSDIPEITELNWLLTCVTAKGQMNRAHAYKASVDANEAAGEETDAGVTMGLYCYPILMAADILLFNAHRVPVGRDQVQHIEMARDVAQRFNHLFGQGKELFVLPDAEIEEAVATLPGLDGRKMSKSYDNTVPLFEGGPKALKDAIARIVTDSRLPGEAKDPDNAHLVTIHDAFATPEVKAAFHADLRAGLGWGDAKQRVVELIEAHVGPMRAKYAELMAHPEQIEDVLQAGAAKARQTATPFLTELRQAVGLRRMVAVAKPQAAAEQQAKVALPVFKQYRESDNQFYFKLTDAQGHLLLQSRGFAEGREAGGWVKRLKTELDTVPGIDISFSQYIQDNVAEALSGVKGENSVKIFGTDLEELTEIAEHIERVLDTTPGVVDAGVLRAMGQPTLNIVIDRAACARFGINVSDLQNVVSNAIGGGVATTVLEGERRVDVSVRLPNADRANADKLGVLLVDAPDGSRIPLNALARIEQANGPFFVYREGAQRYMAVKFGIRGRDLGSTGCSQIKQALRLT